MPPFESLETRWFFEGDSSSHPELRSWFESCTPFRRAADVRVPEWTGRAGGEPDVYLLMPGCSDMGIKWRERTLQIKGRVADLGARGFGAPHAGKVQRWVKWTYPDVPAAYRALFDTDSAHGLGAAAVHKRRALRMISLDSARPEEVVRDSALERGVGFEMTDLELHGERYCSVAFEAFPGDAASEAGFDTVVTGFLGELEIPLGAGVSLSYPDWLCRLSSRGSKRNLQ